MYAHHQSGMKLMNFKVTSQQQGLTQWQLLLHTCTTPDSQCCTHTPRLLYVLQAVTKAIMGTMTMRAILYTIKNSPQVSALQRHHRHKETVTWSARKQRLRSARGAACLKPKNKLSMYVDRHVQLEVLQLLHSIVVGCCCAAAGPSSGFQAANTAPKLY